MKLKRGDISLNSLLNEQINVSVSLSQLLTIRLSTDFTSIIFGVTAIISIYVPGITKYIVK